MAEALRARPTVVVIGAGPGALGAVQRLRGEPAVRVVLVAPGGVASHLPGTLPIAIGDAPIARYRVPVALGGVEVIPAAVEAIETGSVRVGGQGLRADAVIAAPGLATSAVGGANGRVVGFWDLDGALAAAPVIGSFERGVLSVVIAAPLYRCPPAPYGLAIRLARRAQRLGLDVHVRLTTPEPRPLAAIGSAVTEMLLASCAAAGVEVLFDVHPDPDALGAGRVVDAAGVDLAGDLAVVVPPHHAHPLLAALAGPTGLVATDGAGRTPLAGVYAAGDAVAGPFPRAAAPATLTGVAAAQGALVDLGLLAEATTGLPEPDCFVDQGEGRYSRIQISYPDGPPPGGAPAVVIDEPTPASDGGFDEATARWRAAWSGSA